MGAYENALAYAQQRLQFGKPIASFQLIQDLLQVFPPGTDHPKLALVQATRMTDVGRLDEAAAYLAVAEADAETAPPDRHPKTLVLPSPAPLKPASGERRAGPRRGRPGHHLW